MSKTTWAWVSPLALLAAFALAGCGGGGGGGGGSSSGGGGNTTTLSAFTLQPVAVGDPRVATNNTLSWTASSGASGITYDVYRSTTAGTFSGAPLASGLSSTTYTDTTAATGTTYYYEVIANAAGANSATATTSSTGTNSATPGGPVAEGIGDPAGCTGGNAPCVAPGPVFKTGGQINYNTTAGPPASGGFSLTIPLDPTVLGHTPVKSDLQSVSIGGVTYTPATQGAAFGNAVSISGNTLTFSSSTANITVPSAYVPETQGTLYTLSAVVDGQKLELTAPAPPRDGEFHGNQFFPTVNGTTLTYTIQFVNS